MTERKYNFGPGPATLPLPALERAQADLISYAGTGIGIAELSHRSKEFMALMAELKSRLKRLLSIPDDYHILFCQGGASLQFSMIPMNFLKPGLTSDYINTGTWSKKAIKEAERVGKVNVAASTAEENFNSIPRQENMNLTPGAAYVHITSNNTIFGTQYHSFPDTGGVPLMADMSSDILCRPLDVSKFGLLYAGAQKNMGPAGVTVVIVKKELVERCEDNIPSMLNYNTYAAKDSLYNTAPVFALYMVHRVLEWVEEKGGLEVMEKENQAKAELLYGVIDAHPDYFRGHAVKEDRSLMNVTFRLPSEELEAKFVAQGLENGLVGLKGHRSVGGIRVSMYNAMPLAGIEKLTQLMRAFAK